MAAAVQSASARDAILAALNTSREKAESKEGGMESRFLRLLVTQLKNQDPLNPMDNAQMTSQMAQISTVDGIERLNRSLEALMSSSSDGQALQAAQLVGHGALVPGSGIKVSDGFGVAGVELVEPADRVTVTIKDSSGLALRTLELGGKGAGTHSFQWDGRAENGEAVAPGRYAFELRAQRGDTQVSASGLELGVVTGVVRSGSELSLELGTLGRHTMKDIRQII